MINDVASAVFVHSVPHSSVDAWSRYGQTYIALSSPPFFWYLNGNFVIIYVYYNV